MKAILKSGKGKLSDTFPIKNSSKKEELLSPTLLQFVLEYANRRVQADQEGLK